MRNLYPRLAATNLKKNRRFYLPYLLACIVIVALFCIMLTLASDPYLGQMQHGGSVSQVLGFGVFIMALFSAIILFYTNSTFTKQRKREFAIYNILGMEKRHISYVLFWESLYTAAMALFFGLVAAGVFSKLLQLVLVRLIGGEATFGLNIRLMSIGYTVVFFGALFLLLLLNTIRIIHLSNPVQLLRAGSEGEREPRSKWILALLGAVCLAAGYLISLRTNVALYAIQNFFPAVILVIIGTYLTFIALSVVVLKALRKNRRYYYKTSHFATVSGLIYRMSRNAAGLASICILSTMVLVTVSTTVSLYKGLDAYADVRWPQDMTLTLMTDTRTNTVPDVAPVLQVVDDTMTRAGLTQSNVHGYRTVRFSAQRSGDALDLTSEQLTGSSADEYTVMVLDTEGYAGLTGEQVTLAPGEALAWTDGAAFGDTLTLGNTTIRFMETPGHTKGTVSFFFDTEDNGKTYRVGMFGGAGANTLAQGHFDYDGCREGYRNSLNRLRKEKVDVFIGNHVWNNDTAVKGELLLKTGENKFIDPALWGAFLDFCEKRLDEVIAKDTH